MSQVLLIDDELLVIEAIKRNVDWKSCGVSEVFLCDNGFQAQQILVEHEIDLVISDIQMPGMDGLDFGKWLKDSYPDTALLYLSGYAEFEYARTAMTLGAEDYILKPVNYPVLQKKVKTVVAALEQERKRKLKIDFKIWAKLLNEGDTQQLEARVESAIASFSADGQIDPELLQNLYNHFAQTVYSYVDEAYESRFVLLQDEKLRALKANALRSVENYRSYYRSLLERIREFQEAEQSKDVMLSVKKYIDSHIGEKITRTELADLIFYNENYLSRRFREVVGCSISTYITEKRLAVSKRLLTQTSLSVSEIGEKVGYETTAYFIRIFKQQTGKTPNEYRKEKKQET